MFKTHIQRVQEAVSNCIITEQGIWIDHRAGFDTFVNLIRETKASGGIVYVIGNGGSAGIASHFSTDLIKTLHIPSSTFYDSNVLTCLSNDIGYENAFAYPLFSLCLRPSDTLLAISSSGQSQNIINAVNVAREKGVKAITFSGFNETNPLRKLGDLNFWVESFAYGIVEMSHMCLLHTIIDLWPKTTLNQGEQKEKACAIS